MIKKFINKLLDKPLFDQVKQTVRAVRNSSTASRRKSSVNLKNKGKRTEIALKIHKIDLQHVDHRAVDVVTVLQKAGFEAYIVGGAVRDLLVGLRPKDFDVATNATPEQVKQLFRRAFVIGRRFKIVHVVFGRGNERDGDVIEVTTFRANVDADVNNPITTIKGNERTSKAQLANLTHAVDVTGRVLRDNVWGNMEEDAMRRDFSINAMYYNPTTQVVVDFHGGFKDMQKHVLRLIGDPTTRYREDPIRIVRAIRFSAKLAHLGFTIDPDTAAPLQTLLPLLDSIPQSRLFDDMLKLLQTGHAVASINQLKKLGLTHGIYPLLDVIVDRSEDPMVQSVLVNTDRRVQEGKPVVPSFLLACVLWQDVQISFRKSRQNNPKMPVLDALQDGIDHVFHTRIGDISGRGKLAADMRDVWMMQPRFEKRTGSHPYRLFDQPRFRAAFDFMRLRTKLGEVDTESSDWWEAFSVADEDGQKALVVSFQEAQRKKPLPKPKVNTHKSTSNSDELAGIPTQAEGDSVVKKKKRRVRKKRTTPDSSSAFDVDTTLPKDGLQPNNESMPLTIWKTTS